MRRFLLGDRPLDRLLGRAVSLRALLLVVIVSAAIASAVGFAAALAIASKDLTVYTSASTVPVSTCTVSAPAADTYADQALLNAGANFGAATTLHVRSESLGNNKRSFLRFDLSPCSIPATARVVTARTKLFLATAPSASRTYELHRVTESWGEATLTWNNQPTVATLATASVATGTAENVMLELDVLADVRDFVAGTAANNGWRFADQLEGALLAAYEGRFSSREHGTASQRPSLVLTYYP